MYDEDELEEIQNEFKRKELLTHALGPSVSLILHIVLFLVLFFVVKAQFQEEEEQVQVQMVQEVTEEVIETPEDIDDITETELESSDTSESEAPAEDAPDEINTDVSEETLDVPDTELLSFTVDTASPYQTRTVQGKAVQVAKGGGQKRALSTVLSALKWLKANQNPDGSWGERYKNANTGLVTLLYLAHGETPGSKHFGKTVQKALKWLTKRVNNNIKERGDAHEYGYAIMVYALAEGYSLTSINDLKIAMEKGLNRILQGYQSNGGFQYAFKNGDVYDLSFSGWSFQAMKASYLAGSENAKLKKVIKEIPDKLIKAVGYKIAGGSKINAFYYKKGIKGHNKGTELQNSSAMRSIGALTLQLYGEKGKADPAARLIGDKDVRDLRWDTSLEWPLYTWYYATQVVYNNKDQYSKAWRKWNDRFQPVLYESQHKEGYWDPPSNKQKNAHGVTGMDSKINATAFAGLMLTVYYRYLPTTKLTPPKKAKKVTADTQEVELDFL